MDRELRMLRRGLVRDSAESKKMVNDVFDDVSKTDLLEKMKKQMEDLTNVNNMYQDLVKNLQNEIKNRDDAIQEWRAKATIRGNMLKTQEKILLRARHIEVHAEHLSLNHPPIPDAALPNLSFEDWCYWKNMQWCTDNEEAENIKNLENFYFVDALNMMDFRIPSVHALINGVPVPHLNPPFKNTGFIPRHLSNVPVCDLSSPDSRSPRRERSRSPPPLRNSDATTVESSNDSGSKGFMIVPVARQSP
jgi:hypothetical protein